MDFGLRLSRRFQRANDLDCTHRDGKQYVVRADEKLSAFLGLAAAVHADSRQKSETVRRVPAG